MWTPASMGDEACAGGCPKPVHRPYAGKTSATTLVDQIAKKQLTWGASKEAALFAVHHQAEWRHLDPDDAVDRIRRHFQGVWDRSADVGTLIHDVNEAWLYGREWAPQEFDRTKLKVKSDEAFAELLARMPGYVAGLGEFWAQCEPEAIATEVTLEHAELGYVGTADWIAEIGGDVWLLDIKTTSQLDPDKGVYLDSWRPQLAMYQRATHVNHYHAKTLVASWPLEECFPRPTRCGILHLRGDNGFQLIECDTEAPILDELIDALKVMHRWSLKAGHATPSPVIAAAHREEPELIVYEPRPNAPVNIETMLG